MHVASTAAGACPTYHSNVGNARSTQFWQTWQLEISCKRLIDSIQTKRNRVLLDIDIAAQSARNTRAETVSAEGAGAHAKSNVPYSRSAQSRWTSENPRNSVSSRS